MNCDRIEQYLPGYAGGDLGAESSRAVAEHLEGCARCSEVDSRHQRLHAGLAHLQAQGLEPPPFLVDAIVDAIKDRSRRRLLIPPVPAAEYVARTAFENRDAIAGVAGAALLAAGVAWALSRLARGIRAPEPAGS